MNLSNADVQVTNLSNFVEVGEPTFNHWSVNKVHSVKESLYDFVSGILWANSIYSLAASIAEWIKWYWCFTYLLSESIKI